MSHLMAMGTMYSRKPPKKKAKEGNSGNPVTTER